ncbi:MAG: Ig-like domain-containing protein [Methylobacter sp.]|nr:Ig-like domain-containing protein [Methylobacter sp.]
MSSITFRMKTTTMHTKLLDFSRASFLMLMLISLLALALQLISAPLQAAELTIDDGVVVKFGAEAQLVIRDRIVAGKGIILTSQKDDSVMGQLNPASQSPHLGDWLGLRLEKSAAAFGALTLNDLTIQYAGPTVADNTAAALTVHSWSPTLKNLLVTDSGIGLRVLESAAPVITGSSFLRNSTGIEANNKSTPSIVNSQLVGNTMLAINNKTSDAVIQATGNWWGHPTGPKEVNSNLGGLGDAVSAGVNFDGFVTETALFNPSVRLVEPAFYFDQHTVLLDLSCVNATEYRLVEGGIFTKATFQPLTDNRAQVAFTTSAGDGRKQISVEFRDTDGTVATASLEGGVLIDSQAPSLTLTNPANGSVISQPITIDATASDESGIAKVEFFIDDQRVAGITAAPFSYNWNTNNSTDGAHSIRVVATDIAGRISEQTATVTLSHSAPIADTQGPQLTNVSAHGDLVTDGMTLARSTTINFTASDPSGVAHRITAGWQCHHLPKREWQLFGNTQPRLCAKRAAHPHITSYRLAR